MQQSLPLQFSHRRTTCVPHVSRAGRPTTRPKYFFDFSSGKGFLRNVGGGWHIPSFSQQPIVCDAKGFAAIAQRPLLPVEKDWLEVALALYSADRFAPRYPAGPSGPSFWRRSIEMVLPVEEPARWQAVTPSLTAALEFLTEDDWELKFTQRTFRFAEEQQQQFPTANMRRFKWVALFSGGLDSTAGALRQLSEHVEPGLLVSGNTHARLRDAQEQLVRMLQADFHNRVEWLPVQYGFLPRVVEPHGMESSQRCRGWMHVGLGLLAALLSGVDDLFVFENGTGAFNLPCELSQIGSQNSRAIHPVFLHRIATVASKLFARKLCIHNPFIFETKGGTLRHAAVAVHPHILAKSISCDVFPNYYSRQRQCGVCPSCLVRRAGLLAARLPDDGAAYSWDMLRRGLPQSPKRSTGFVKLERFAARLQHVLDKREPWDAFLISFPEYALLQAECTHNLGLTSDQFCCQFLRLQRDFRSEWQPFAERVSRLRHSTHSLAA